MHSPGEEHKFFSRKKFMHTKRLKYISILSKEKKKTQTHTILLLIFK